MASRKVKLQVCRVCRKLDVERVITNASKRGHAECVKACVESGVDVNNRALNDAVKFGHDDCVEVLVKAGAEIHNRLVETAAETGSERCVKLILEAGGDPDDMLLPAIYERRHNIVELLLREGANANCESV